MILTREEILAKRALPTETVQVPEWGGEVLVRAWSGQERDAYDEVMYNRNKGREGVSLENMRARLAAWSIVDENGQHLFTEADVEALGQLSGAALERVCAVARRLSGMGEDEEEALEKNSESDQGDGLPSA